ncbi:MAG: ATP-binding cassette domain-containing protein [Ruminococcus sp.]
MLVEGQSVKIGNPTEAIKLGIGMVPQELNLNPFVTAAENIFLGNEIKTGGRINWKKTNEEAVKVMKSIGLDINPTTIVSRLSSAQQQLVQLSRVLRYWCQDSCI